MNDAVNSTTLVQLDERNGKPRRKHGNRKRIQLAQRDLPLSASTLSELENIIDDFTEITTPEPDQPDLSWEEREAAGNAELINIYMDALKRPMSDAEFARAGQIVETLNAHNPGPKCQRQALY